MTEQELIEQLADKEHASWARWMEYLFSLCLNTVEGDVVIPADLARHWVRECQTAYADLSLREKQSDRDEVAHILPIIREYVAANTTQEIVLQVDGRELARAVVREMPGVIRNSTGMRH